MVDLEEEPEWAIADQADDEDQESNPITGESALDRISCGLGGKALLPHLLAAVPQMLANGM